MECLIACNDYPNCPCGEEGLDILDVTLEEFLDPEEFDDWFTEEE